MVGEPKDPTRVRIVLGLGREQEKRVLRSLRFQESLGNGGRYPDTPGPISRLYVCEDGDKPVGQSVQDLGPGLESHSEGQAALKSVGGYVYILCTFPVISCEHSLDWNREVLGPSLLWVPRSDCMGSVASAPTSELFSRVRHWGVTNRDEGSDSLNPCHVDRG